MHWFVDTHSKEPLKQSVMAERKSKMTITVSYISFYHCWKTKQNKTKQKNNYQKTLFVLSFINLDPHDLYKLSSSKSYNFAIW